MFYLIETPDQFAEMRDILVDKCYIDYVLGNDNTHPAIAEVIAIYISSFERKGFMIPLNHPECINFEEGVWEWINNKEFYTKDLKAALHINPIPHYTDIQHLHYKKTNQPFEDNFNTHAHNFYYRKFPNIKVNKIIPIGKHFERCEQRKNALSTLLNQEPDKFYNNLILPSLYNIEKNSIKINKYFDVYYKPNCKKHSIKNNNIYGWYNPYTTTGRPVNNFNGLSFMRLKHGTGERKSFEPKNNILIEIDYSGYHPRLIADMVGFSFTKDNVYDELNEVYNDPNINPKEHTFKQIYGGIKKENLHHPFFNKTQEYIDLNWEVFNRIGYVETKLGKKIYKENHPKLNPQQLFNYLIQSYETETNMQIISELDIFLKNQKSKLILYVYDSFLFDFSKEDGKETLIIIKKIISKNYPVKLKIGENYNELSAF
jgi:hypothetical protein